MTGPRSDPPMPILITLLMRLPVWPFQAPPRSPLAKSAILSRTAWTSGTTLRPSYTIVAPRGARSARGTAPSAPAPGKRGVDLLPQLRFANKLQQQSYRFIRDPVLGIVEIEPGGFDRRDFPPVQRSSAKSCRRCTAFRKLLDSASPAMPRRDVSARAAWSLIARSWSLMGASLARDGPHCHAQLTFRIAAPLHSNSHQVIPRFDKRRSAFVLQLRSQCIDYDARLERSWPELSRSRLHPVRAARQPRRGRRRP